MNPIKLTLVLQIFVLLIAVSGYASYTVNVNTAREFIATGEKSLRLVPTSLHYGDRYQKETVKMVFRLANDLHDETIRKRYLEMTSRYVEPDKILQSGIEYYTRITL